MNAHWSKVGFVSLAIAGALLLGAGCGGDSDDDTQQINLISDDATVNRIDNGKIGPSEGDVNVFDNPVRFSDSGEEAGHLYGTQTTVGIDGQKEIVQAAFTFRLADGSISIGGVGEYTCGADDLTKEEEFERPIIGGTGPATGISGLLPFSYDESAIAGRSSSRIAGRPVR